MGQANDELDQLRRAKREPEWFAADTSFLDDLAASRGQDLAELLSDGIDAMDGSTWPTAARILFVNHRNSNLTSRRRKVQSEVGIGVETLRPKNGVGEELDIQASLAEAIVGLAHLDPDTPQTVVDAAQLEPVEAQLSGQRSGWLLPAAIGAGVVLVVIVAVMALRSGETDGADQILVAEDADLAAGPVDVTSYCETIEGIGARAEERSDGSGGWDCFGADRSETPADLTAACAYLYGDGVSSRENDPGSTAGRWSCVQLLDPAGDDGCRVAAGAWNPDPTGEFEALSEPFTDAAAGTELGCARNRIHRWQLGYLQDFDNGIIAALDLDTIVVLEGEPAVTFDRIKGISNEFAGYPTGPSMPQPDGHWAIPLTSSGAMVSESETGEYFWIPPVFYPGWLSVGGLTGCLGAPLVEPFTSGSGFVMDFEGGAISVNMVTLELSVDADTC